MLFNNLSKIKQEMTSNNTKTAKLEKTVSVNNAVIRSIQQKCKHYMLSDNKYIKEAVSDIYDVVAKIKL